jgi:hypothetical protein
MGAKKPWRLWILQAIATLQVVLTVVRGIPLARAAGKHLLELAGLWWFLQMVFPVTVAVVLVLAIERVIRRSDVVAPVAGGLWWAYGLYGAINALGAPPPPDLKHVMFEDVPVQSEIAALVVIHGVLLFLAGSLLWHRKSRAYLAGATPTGAAHAAIESTGGR